MKSWEQWFTRNYSQEVVSKLAVGAAGFVPFHALQDELLFVMYLSKLVLKGGGASKSFFPEHGDKEHNACVPCYDT